MGFSLISCVFCYPPPLLLINRSTKIEFFRYELQNALWMVCLIHIWNQIDEVLLSWCFLCQSGKWTMEKLRKRKKNFWNVLFICFSILFIAIQLYFSCLRYEFFSQVLFFPLFIYTTIVPCTFAGNSTTKQTNKCAGARQSKLLSWLIMWSKFGLYVCRVLGNVAFFSLILWSRSFILLCRQPTLMQKYCITSDSFVCVLCCVACMDIFVPLQVTRPE